MSETIASDVVIDVYTDVIPEPYQRSRGMGPIVHDLATPAHPNGGSPHDFLTPKPEPPHVERPSVWDASCLNAEDLLTRIETFPPCAGPRV